MQQSALTAPVRVISHFCCYKSTTSSVMTGVENDFWSRQNVVLLCLYKGSAGRFSFGASGKARNENFRLEERKGGVERQVN